MSAEKNNAGKMVWLNTWMAEKKDCREELLQRRKDWEMVKRINEEKKKDWRKMELLKIMTDEKNSWREKLPKKSIDWRIAGNDWKMAGDKIIT